MFALLSTWWQHDRELCDFTFFFPFFLSTDGVTSVDQTGIVSTHRIRKLITDLKQCVYMEASALTGDNVDRVFTTGEFLKQGHL